MKRAALFSVLASAIVTGTADAEALREAEELANRDAEAIIAAARKRARKAAKRLKERTP